MNYIQDNKIYIISCLAAGSCAAYLVSDIISKLFSSTNTDNSINSETIQCRKKSNSKSQNHLPQGKKFGPYLLESNISRNNLTIMTNQNQEENLIYKICLTGGPSSGKTTGIIINQKKILFYFISDSLYFIKQRR